MVLEVSQVHVQLALGDLPLSVEPDVTVLFSLLRE